MKEKTTEHIEISKEEEAAAEEIALLYESCLGRKVEDWEDLDDFWFLESE